MQGIKNLYSELNCIITDRELRDQASIKIEDIVSEVRKRVNVHSASRKWLEYRVLMASAENVLWRRGYRSLVKSKGWFVHLENCSKPEFLKRLFNNAKLSEAQKEAVVNRIKKQIKIIEIADKKFALLFQKLFCGCFSAAVKNRETQNTSAAVFRHGLDNHFA